MKIIDKKSLNLYEKPNLFIFKKPTVINNLILFRNSQEIFEKSSKYLNLLMAI